MVIILNTMPVIPPLQLTNQLTTLARQAKQAIRYRDINEQLRKFEGILLYGLWKEAEEALREASQKLTECLKEEAVLQSKAMETQKLRENAETKLPPMREEQANSAALFQRLKIQKDSIKTEEERAEKRFKGIC